MLRKRIVFLYTWCILAFGAPLITNAETVGLFYDSNVEQIKFAANDVKSVLETKSYTVEILPLSTLNNNYSNKKVVIALANNSQAMALMVAQGGSAPTNLGEQAYALRNTTSPQSSFWVIGGDVNGAMYGALEIAENFPAGGFIATYNKQESPFMLNRGMKLNMPLDKRIPTYVGGWSSTSTGLAIPHVWDMTFWKTLIDQQARYRYNFLSVWVHHPFPALVKLTKYPNASLDRIEGDNGFVLNLNHDQRVAFWREVMQYAHNRGMKFYFFNWNIYVDYASTKYPAITRDQNNATTIDYMYLSMKALIETYPELDGFGISAGDGMDGSTSNTQKTTWTWNAMGKAVKDYCAANPSRNFNLIHRSIGSGTNEWNTIYAPLDGMSNVKSNYSHKYAQAHMYSTPTPGWTTNGIKAISDFNKKSFITVRNDDYFYINWGDPKFVKDFINGIPYKNSVLGMYIGSDGYTPSRSYLYKNPVLNNQLDVQRRWYMEMLWGRISYNPQISDDVFKNMLQKRFPSINSTDLFNAWSYASRPLPRATELIMQEWSLDFDWYPEGCNSDPGRCTGFRTVQDFANVSTHPNAKATTVATGSNLCDIPNSAANTCNGKKSSYTVADEMQADAQQAINLINTMNSMGNLELEMAMNNIKQMAYLSMYYAHKVRGATFLSAKQTVKAKDEMAKAYCWWMSYSRSMDKDYNGTSFRNMEILPDWKYADANVLKDYTSLGGVGVPSCDFMDYKITVNANDANGGTVTGGGVFKGGTNVTVVASVKPGYKFISWTENGDVVTGATATYSFSASSERVLIANFRLLTACDVPWYDKGITVNKTTVNKTFGPIDISCITQGVELSLEVQGIGVDNSDYCRIYYKVDGGAEIPIIDQNGLITFKKMTVNGIKGKSLEIIVRSYNSFGDEFYHIKNINVIDPLAVGIKLQELENVTIYPNPASDMLHISFPNGETNREVSIVNMLGQVLFSTKTMNSTVEIDVQSFNFKGMVVVKIKTADSFLNRMVLIK